VSQHLPPATASPQPAGLSLLAQYGLDAAVRDIMQAQFGEYPKRDAKQNHDRSGPYRPTIAHLFALPEGGVI